ncbi:MAG: alpha/beta hydrolase [Acetobacter sp.]|nr:alpha/beta hydrolase [Acetobacter sp.]MCH4062647.1 alpha/beta hydrolase [Acetobacter sp.]MCH4088507.1 alpha/beta hydrolase [Acetobacter sp.]MCI1293974.1 alpha/beta hydrolase [Acetobacter sp.]MCI1320635.1 alpha/beta hydrolase [Acetobacter sp.]
MRHRERQVAMRNDIEFSSEGRTLRGWLYRPEGEIGKYPGIIMAHGLSGVKEQYLDRYAEVFVSAGFGVILYDHANFGASDGMPRQEADPMLQKRGYRDAISFAQTVSWIDPQRIGLWGTSYSGGHVLEVAALDRRVRCVVSQVPTISGYRSSLRRLRSDLVPSFLASLEADRAARFQGKTPVVFAAVSDRPEVSCAMGGADAYAFFTVTRSFAPTWRNELTLRSAEFARENEPGIHIARISPTPLLMIVADQDILTATDICLEGYQSALPPKKLHMIHGGHFDPYVRCFEETSQAARDWFTEYLINDVI